MRRLLRRWPTALGVTSAAVFLHGATPAEATAGFGELLPLLAVVYVVAATLGRRRTAWPVLAAGFVIVLLLGLQRTVAPPVALVALGVVALAAGVLGPHRHHGGGLGLQTIGLVVFGGLAGVGLVVGPEVGRYVIGAGWLLHGVWDLVHLRRDEVVPRAYAEWCGVLDIGVGGYLVLG